MLSTTQIKVEIRGGKVKQPQQAASPEPSHKLTNQDIIDMAALKLSDDVIIDKIHAVEATAFDTSIKALKTLKAANVPDAVIRVMINTHSIPAAAPAGVSESSGLPQDTNLHKKLAFTFYGRDS
jgi:hypothetical protein